MKSLLKILWLSIWGICGSVFANIPGGGNGTGANVTLVDNGNGTVTMGNGIISIVITKSSAEIHQINYTWNNGGGTQTQQLLSGGKNGGMFYWEFGGFGSGSFSYSVVSNTPDYCEVDLFLNSATNGAVDVHFSMLRGSPGFYVTPIFFHRAQDGPQGTGEERDNIYFSPIFNWMSVNDQVQREVGLNATYAPAFYSPGENSLVTSGVLQGTYDDKYKWSADFGVERVWGWSSVSDAAIGFTGKNIGIWHVVASGEFYNGGPLKPELNDAPMVHMINGGHYYFGNDSDFGNGEVWTRVSGPYFIYFNNVTNTLTNPVQASQALWADAKAQAVAEATAWPYSWMSNTNYAPASQRGTVTGKFVINDSGNPNASAANLWVGVVQQPTTVNGIYDFQLWMKPYQFWVQSDANGNFTIPDVIAGNNYTLYAFGPGGMGTFMSKSQSGGNPQLLYNLASPQFTVVVTGGATNNLGTVTWTPNRNAPTVFEIGYPTRKGDKFLHGDDYWIGDEGQSPTAPSPIWTKFMEFPFDFPNGLNYVVGQNRWNTDWNYIQSVYPDYNGNSVVSSSTVTFNLASAPANGSTAYLLLGIASDDNSPLLITVNGTLLSSGNATGTPQTSLPGSGWFPINDNSDTNVREENHAAYSDERLTFAGSLLHAGNNTINFSFRQAGGSGFTHHFIYDYIRLELTGYVPPAPASVTAYPGNNCNLICWPAVVGATSYNILRSTTSGSGYVSITNGVVGPVCGSGPQNATFVDATAANGTPYYYVVQSVNPTGTSVNSPQSSGVTPSAGISTSAPATPTVIVTSTNNGVTLSWNAVPGANFHTIQRGTVLNKLGYVAFYSTLDNATTGTSFTDASGTLGCTYSYIVTATSAAGTGGTSTAVTGKPIPPPPASAPANVKISDSFTSTNQNITITWSPVSGAVGYILYRSTSAGGPFSFPGNYIQSMTTTNYLDDSLALNTRYYYTVVAMNAGGISTNSVVVGSPPAPPGAPASLSAIPGDSQITLSWPAVSTATGYYLFRGTSSGNENVTVLANYSGTSYTNTGLVNGTTYYYFVIATNAGGSGPNSPEASATPGASIAAAHNLIWKGDGVSNVWDVSGAANWQSNGIVTVFNSGDAVTFDDTGSNNVSVAFTGTLQPALVTFNATKNYTFAGTGTLSGTNALVKSNSGTLTLSATNTYIGGTTVSGGRLTFNSGITIPSSGTLTLNNTGAVTVVTANGLPNVLVNGTNSITGNGNSGTGAATLDVEGALTIFVTTGSKVFDLTGPITGGGTLTLGTAPMGLRFNGTGGGSGVTFNLGTGANGASIRNAPFAIALGGLVGGTATTLSGASSANTPATFTLGGANATVEFDGVIADGGQASHPAVTVIKTGGNTQIFGNANTYSGGTTVNGGTLQINNSTGSGTGSGAVTVASGGTLAGNGIISGAVTVQNGGAIAPGNPLGTLTLNSNLTLASGSTTFMRLQPSPLTNSALIVSGTLVQGGALSVTNVGVAFPAGGDAFKLFQAGSFGGAFTNFILPALPAGLAWNTSTLGIDGTISVSVTTPPTFTSISFSAGSLVLNGAGVPGSAVWLLTSTNISTPRANWTRLLTNHFDVSGNLVLTNAPTDAAQQFYMLQQP